LPLALLRLRKEPLRPVVSHGPALRFSEEKPTDGENVPGASSAPQFCDQYARVRARVMGCYHGRDKDQERTQPRVMSEGAY
jgi:hypothetical protein